MKLLNNDKGSSSILVVLCFLMLGIFSVLGMLSSYSDYKLALKNAQWTRDYYSLEAQAQSFASEVDALMLEKQETAASNLEAEISSLDSEAVLEESEDGLLVSRVFQGASGKKVIIEIEIVPKSGKRFDIKTLKEVPEVMEYQEDLEFEEVEVPGT